MLVKIINYKINEYKKNFIKLLIYKYLHINNEKLQ